MEPYIGVGAHAASCTLAVISERGRKLEDFPVETNGQVSAASDFSTVARSRRSRS